MIRVLVIGAALLITACSDHGDTTGSQVEPVKDGDHVWKTQTDQIDRAREVENVLQQEHAQQQQAIDAQTR